MAIRSRLIVALIVWNVRLTSAWTAEPECGVEELTGGRQASYCIQTPEGGSNSGRVTYYLHGLGGSERQAYEQGLTADATSSTVIAVSFGPLWLFAPKEADAPGSATMQVFVDELMPRLESRLGGPVENGKRAVVGGSMGGFNATQLFEQYPESFGRVGLLCPGLSEVSPYADEEEILDYIRRTGADPVTVARAVVIGRFAFPTEEIWNAATPFNPKNLERVGQGSSPLFVSIGRQDEWGFYEGTEAFVEKVREQGVGNLEWKPVEGPHCSFDQEALKAFLAE